jgi:non-ribosomal peptide synthetase component F
LQRLSLQEGGTLYMTMLTAFKILLYRYSGQQDISIGTPVAGRQQQEIEGLIGFFVNTLVLRNTVNGEMSFVELLQQVKQTTLNAYTHQDVPFAKVVDTLVKERDLSRSPLFQIMFTLQDDAGAPSVTNYLGELKILPEQSGYNISKFDLSFSIAKLTEGLLISLEYCTDLFEEKTISHILNRYIALLHVIVIEPDKKIGDIAIQGKVPPHQVPILVDEDNLFDFEFDSLQAE